MRRNKTTYRITFLTLIATVLLSCGGEFQTFDLSDDYMTSLHYKGSQAGGEEEEDQSRGVPAKGYYNGDLIGGAIWWARKGITIDRDEDFLVIAENIGPESTPFGATFPPLDFIGEDVMIKITARAESKTGQEPSMHFEFHDGKGFVSNAMRPFVVIKNTEDVEEYYVNLKGAFMQSLPEKHKVNGGFINSIQVYINPGGEAYTGKIFIEEIKVIAAQTSDE